MRAIKEPRSLNILAPAASRRSARARRCPNAIAPTIVLRFLNNTAALGFCLLERI